MHYVLWEQSSSYVTSFAGSLFQIDVLQAQEFSYIQTIGQHKRLSLMREEGDPTVYIFTHSLATLLDTPCLYRVGPTFSFRTALILRGIDSTRYWKHSSEILVHIDIIASSSCCRFVGCTSMMRISCSTTSQRCSIWLRSGDCRGHLSKVNSLSCSRNQSEAWNTLHDFWPDFPLILQSEQAVEESQSQSADYSWQIPQQIS